MYFPEIGWLKIKPFSTIPNETTKWTLSKDFQQDIIADMELITGVDMSKKSLPKTLADEIEKKKQNRLKENGWFNVLGFLNKRSISA